MNTEDIRKLMETMAGTGLTELVLEEKDFRLQLSRQTAVAAPAAASEEPLRPASPVGEQAPVPVLVPAVEDPGLHYVVSPIVGTYYESPAPGHPAFVKSGDRVKKGQVVCIIEAMKLMNEIKADADGVVDAVLVHNEEMVEFNQPLIAIRPEGR